LSGTTRVSRYQKGKTNLDFTEARDSEWQWHQLGHMQTGNHASTPPLGFVTGQVPFLPPTNSVKALKAQHNINTKHYSQVYSPFTTFGVETERVYSQGKDK